MRRHHDERRLGARTAGWCRRRGEVPLCDARRTTCAGDVARGSVYGRPRQRCVRLGGSNGRRKPRGIGGCCVFGRNSAAIFRRLRCIGSLPPSHPYPIFAMPREERTSSTWTKICICRIRNAHQEGYDNIELMKRYTTVGMGPSQGKLSNMNAVRILARLNGKSIKQREQRRHGRFISLCRWAIWPAAAFIRCDTRRCTNGTCERARR